MGEGGNPALAEYIEDQGVQRRHGDGGPQKLQRQGEKAAAEMSGYE